MRTWLVPVLVCLCGCAPPLAMRGAGVTIDPRRVVVMEPNVAVGQLSVDDLVTRQDWTRAARANVHAALQARARRSGARLLDARRLEASAYARFYSWAYGALGQISLRARGKAYKDARSVTQWHYDETLVPWRTALDADHVLLVRFRDAHETTARALVNLFGGRHPRQVGVACWVSLRTGFVDWCEHRLDPRGDLRSANSAQHSVDQLLEQLLPAGQTALPVP